MKRVCHALLVLFVSALVFTSCKKEKDDPSIVGKWGLYEEYIKETNNGNIDEETYPITPNSEDYYTVEFKADGTYFITAFGDTDHGTYHMEGNKLHLKDSPSDEVEIYEFTLHETELHTILKESGSNWSLEYVSKFRRL